MIQKVKIALLLLVILLIAGCSGLRIEKEEPVVSSLAFTGKYKIENMKSHSGENVKYIGELNMLDANGIIYISGERHSAANPKKVNKFKGKGKYDQKTKTVLFTFIVNEKEYLQGEYKKTDYGFEWINGENSILEKSSPEKWIKMN